MSDYDWYGNRADWEEDNYKRFKANYEEPVERTAKDSVVNFQRHLEEDDIPTEEVAK